MPTQIPLPADESYFTLDVYLTDATYKLEFSLNSRENNFYIDVYNDRNELLVASCKLVIDHPITKRFRNPALPKGYLIAVNTTGQKLDPFWAPAPIDKSTLADIVLLYYEAAEYVAIIQSQG